MKIFDAMGSVLDIYDLQWSIVMPVRVVNVCDIILEKIGGDRPIGQTAPDFRIIPHVAPLQFAGNGIAFC